MNLSFTAGNTHYHTTNATPHSLAIPIRFDGQGISAFGSGQPSREAFRSGTFIGDVSQGGSCNCESYHFAPHLHGTHTEGLGHLTHERLAVSLPQPLMPATLITLTPEYATAETYACPLRATDPVITAAALQSALAQADDAFLAALIIRTLPNDDSKKTRNHDAATPPFFSTEAMACITSLPVQHLLVDFPSIDRTDDGGKLANHRLFWGIKTGNRTAPHPPSQRTVTELIYVPPHVPDGRYLLNLQLAPLEADATPSNPLLYEIEPL